MTEITYAIEIVQDDIPVRGNAIASGDDVFDKKVEDEILERLNRGDDWAWALVKVIAAYGGFTGTAYLGCCSYKDEDEFKQPDGYYPQLCQEAKEDLLSNMRLAVARGAGAQSSLEALA